MFLAINLTSNQLHFYFVWVLYLRFGMANSSPYLSMPCLRGKSLHRTAQLAEKGVDQPTKSFSTWSTKNIQKWWTQLRKKKQLFFLIGKSCKNEQILGDLRYHQMIHGWSTALGLKCWITWATEGWGFSHANCHLCWTCTSLVVSFWMFWAIPLHCAGAGCQNFPAAGRICCSCTCGGQQGDDSKMGWLQTSWKRQRCVVLGFLECFWPQIIEFHARILPQTASWCLVMLPTIPPRKKWCALWPFGPFVYNKWERRQSPTS